MKGTLLHLHLLSLAKDFLSLKISFTGGHLSICVVVVYGRRESEIFILTAQVIYLRAGEPFLL